MDKSNHRVTVDREYLELLEGVYRDVTENDYNLSGKVMKVRNPISPFDERILFVKENAITKQSSEKIIVTDETGRERMIYRLESKIVY